MKEKLITYLSSLMMILVVASCQKIERPKLSADYPTDDQTLPAGDLRFYVPFGGTNSQARFNVPDEVSGNPAIQNSLTFVDGINGQAIQGEDGKAIKYMNANDIKLATSFTIALWVKSTVPAGRTEFLFSLVDDKYGWHHSAIFLMMEHGTATATTLKLGLMDQWLEFPDASQYPRPVLDGNWHHLAFVYDETTSKMKYYFDGASIDEAPTSATDVKNGSNPRGAVDLSTAKNLVLGGWNKQVNIAGPTDDWIKSFTGSMDQFRMYKKALSGAEVQALFTNKE